MRPSRSGALSQKGPSGKPYPPARARVARQRLIRGSAPAARDHPARARARLAQESLARAPGHSEVRGAWAAGRELGWPWGRGMGCAIWSAQDTAGAGRQGLGQTSPAQNGLGAGSYPVLCLLG